MDIILHTIQLNDYQSEFFAWCNKHHHQLKDIRQSKGLEIPGSSFSVHLKDSMNLDIPPLVDHIDLNGKYYPK